MKRKGMVADKMVRPVEDKALTPAAVEIEKPARVYVHMRPGRSVRAGGVLIMPGQYVWVEKTLADQLIASGYADYVREA